MAGKKPPKKGGKGKNGGKGGGGKKPPSGGKGKGREPPWERRIPSPREKAERLKFLREKIWFLSALTAEARPGKPSPITLYQREKLQALSEYYGYIAFDEILKGNYAEYERLIKRRRKFREQLNKLANEEISLYESMLYGELFPVHRRSGTSMEALKRQMDREIAQRKIKAENLTVKQIEAIKKWATKYDLMILDLDRKTRNMMNEPGKYNPKKYLDLSEKFWLLRIRKIRLAAKEERRSLTEKEDQDLESFQRSLEIIREGQKELEEGEGLI